MFHLNFLREYVSSWYRQLSLYYERHQFYVLLLWFFLLWFLASFAPSFSAQSLSFTLSLSSVSTQFWFFNLLNYKCSTLVRSTITASMQSEEKRSRAQSTHTYKQLTLILTLLLCSFLYHSIDFVEWMWGHGTQIQTHKWRWRDCAMVCLHINVLSIFVEKIVECLRFFFSMMQRGFRTLINNSIGSPVWTATAGCRHIENTRQVNFVRSNQRMDKMFLEWSVCRAVSRRNFAVRQMREHWAKWMLSRITIKFLQPTRKGRLSSFHGAGIKVWALPLHRHIFEVFPHFIIYTDVNCVRILVLSTLPFQLGHSFVLHIVHCHAIPSNSSLMSYTHTHARARRKWEMHYEHVWPKCMPSPKLHSKMFVYRLLLRCRTNGWNWKRNQVNDSPQAWMKFYLLR